MRNTMVKGYFGFYKGIYLRSSLEFAYAYYLDHKGYNWAYEKESYDLGECVYIPDFFIYDNNGHIEFIVEIKGEGNGKTGIEKMELFKTKYSIPIKMLFYKDLVKLYQEEMPIRYNKAKTMWINDYGAKLNEQWNSGKNNHMYGVKHKESTKATISKKAKERFKDEDYKKHITNNLIEHNIKTNFACCKGERSQREVRECANPNCKETFIVTVKSKRKYCSKKCAGNNTSQIARQENKNKYDEKLTPVKDYIYKWVIENNELVLNTEFNKITTTLKPLFDNIEKKFNVKDMRTISKAIFGVNRGRKELLHHLKNYIIKMYAELD